MTKCLALTNDGKIIYCAISEENIGKYRCNYIAYQEKGESIKDFCKRIKDIKLNKIDTNNDNKIKNLNVDDKIKLIESEDINDEILDILVNDKSLYVRCKVAEHGRDKDLDVLVNDKNRDVRAAVAKCGRDKDLDVLVYDKNWYVRTAVARQKRDKDLDILVNDEDWFVRKTVAKYGRNKDLDKLINDKNRYVRNTVIENINFKYDSRLAYYDGKLEMIKEGCSDKEMNLIRKGSKNKEIKLALIEKGIDVEKFLTDKNEEVQNAAFKKIIEK